MNRSLALRGVAIVLGGYGVYRALFVIPMLVAPATPLIVVLFLLQALAGILAGVGLWRGVPWAPQAVVALGVAVAATALIEAFVLGILAYLRALLEAVIAIVAAFLVAVWVRAR